MVYGHWTEDGKVTLVPQPMTLKGDFASSAYIIYQVLWTANSVPLAGSYL